MMTHSACVHCQKNFTPYVIDETCGICKGEGYVEDTTWMMGETERKCYACFGKGEIMKKENYFCNEECKENHFNETI